jgi:hypothetical protein
MIYNRHVAPLVAVYAVFIMGTGKQSAMIPAACAGPYGRKNTRGTCPRAF